VPSIVLEVSIMPQSQVQGNDRSAEAELIRRAVRKEKAAVRSIIQAHNRRLYRVARGVVRDDGEAEDVLQEAYFRAFSGAATESPTP
jgi:RNA polymerase sigma-70 factor (ECF subfamily)